LWRQKRKICSWTDDQGVVWSKVTGNKALGPNGYALTSLAFVDADEVPLTTGDDAKDEFFGLHLPLLAYTQRAVRSNGEGVEEVVAEFATYFRKRLS